MRRVAFLIAAVCHVTILQGALAQQGKQIARVLVVNPDDLAAKDGDTDLVEDLCKAFNDDAWRLNWERKSDAPSAADLMLLLISLGSPDEITTSARVNNGFAVKPVKDFDKFVAAIDYGRVVGQDDNEWIVKVRVDPAEVDRDKLIARAQATGRRPAGLDNLKGGGRGPRMPRMAMPNMPNATSGLTSSAAPPPKLAKGDRIESQLGPLKIEGVVEESDDEAALLRVSDVTAITKKLSDVKLKGRLRRAETLSIWLPLDRIKLLQAAAPQPTPGSAIAIGPRTWTDTTGRFQIVATYGGVSGDKVRLAKPTGAEVLVPLAKLCEADQQYVSQLRSGANAAPAVAVAAPPAASRSLQADWKGVKEVEGKDFSKWTFAPPAGPTARASTPAKVALNLDTPPEVGTFGEELERLFVASDGSAAIGVIVNDKGPDAKRYLQLLDFRSGKAEPLVELPENSLVLDALPDQRLILMRPDIFGHSDENGRLYIQQLSGGKLHPVSDWMAAPADSFHKEIESASFLADGRVMTSLNLGDGTVLWSREDARATHGIPIPRETKVKEQLDPTRRYLAIASNAAVSLIDTTTGEHVATVTHDLGEVKATGMNEGMTRLAVWTENEIAAWDLTTGEAMFRSAAPKSHFNDSLDWVGDLLLVGGKYLIDADRRVILWQYEVASSGSKQHVVARAGRLWYAPESERGLSLYVASIAAPHDAAAKRLSELGSPDQLLIAKPGSAVYVTVETDRGVEVEKQLEHAIGESLTRAGYQVVDKASAGADALEAAVICKALPQQEVRINMSRSPFPDSWDIVERSVTPYISRVALKQGDVELWSDGWRAEPGHVIWIEKDETLDEALTRLTSPNIEQLVELRFASHLAKPGKATPEGAYGVSKLTSAGVVANHLGDE